MKVARTLGLFEEERALAEREQALEAVAGDGTWVEEAIRAVVWCASTMVDFTADDVWLECRRRGMKTPREPRIMGAVMAKAARAGICVPTSYWRISERVRNHGRPLRVWMLR